MPYYAPNNYYAPPPPGTRSRGSSNASRYVPEGYHIPPPTSKTEEDNQLAVPQQSDSQPESDAHAFVPVRPEQYRPPPDTRGIPPAQLRPLHPDARVRSRSDGYDARRSLDARRPRSVDSRYSDDPRRSYHSVRSHRSSHDSHRGSHESHRDAGRREYERQKDIEYERERERERRHRKHHHHHDEDDKNLKRRDTPRGYGSSLWSVFDHIKNALR